MHDPLTDFEWGSLYRRYDALCKGYDSGSHCLARFGSARPDSDRELYYRLISCYLPAARTADRDVIGTYQALLYWKLYSTAGSRGTNILAWLKPGSAGRRSAESTLPRWLSRLPPSLNRNESDVVEKVREMPLIRGMGTECRLPVRTTFLHFLYPSVVPIFDRNVLLAVGVNEKNANQSYDRLREYLPFAWELADRYCVQSAMCNREESLRRIDMALWVTRGSRKHRIAGQEQE